MVQKMMKRFDLIYEDIMSSLDTTKFNFKKDEDGNVFCIFDIKRSTEKVSVIAKRFGDKFTFTVNKDGKTSELSEKVFATTYNTEYENFKKAFEKLEDPSEEGKEDSKVLSFDDQMKNLSSEEGHSKGQKNIKIDGQLFIFTLLDDPIVTNFCECNFQLQDEETFKPLYFRVLLNLREVNSTIVKILELNDAQEQIDILTESDLRKKNEELYFKFKKAVKKMEKDVFAK